MLSRIKVLVVDDSALLRMVISDVIKSHEDLEVVATARDGMDALEKIRKLKPDVVTLDIDMPRLDGIKTLERIMQENPLPVVMISSHTRMGSESTLRALDIGAVDFLAKPARISSEESIVELKDVVPQKIIAAASAKISNIPVIKPAAPEPPQKDLSRLRAETAQVLVAIGASTGGPNALEAFFTALPADLPAAVLVTQHMPPGFTTSFSQRLDNMSPLSVKEAASGDALLKGRALVAPGGFHMVIKKGLVHLDEGPKVNYVKPSVDVMLESLVTCSQKVVVMIMTGMGKDGALGAASLKKYKNDTVMMAQDPVSALIPSMPEALIKSVPCEVKAPPVKLAFEIDRYVRSMA